MNKGEPNQQAFDKLLRWLDPDRDKAGARYEKIRHRLISIFACRGCCDAEDLADQTINVVLVKIDWLIENYDGNPELYFYAVAKKIFLEHLKKKPPPTPPLPDPDPLKIERHFSCLEQCLQRELTPSERELVLRYYQNDGQERIRLRRQLAEELGISLNALRIRIYYLLARLRPCITKCLRQLGDM